MSPQKLIALDEDDLAVISAHVQDARVRTSHIVWRQNEKRVVIALELQRHRAAEQGGFAPDQRIGVRVDRIRVRRREQPRPVAPHLVHRQKHLRVPLRVEEPRQVPILDHVHHEPVAIDVVADVLVIEPRHRSTLERRAFLFVVPVDDETMAVGIQRWNQNQDDVLQDGERLWIGGRRQ